MSNEVKYEKGDILWDSKNNVLYVYSSDENLIKEGIHVACPIPLNDLIFTKVLNFKENLFGGFDYSSIHVDFIANEQGRLYYCDGQPMCMLHDIQQIARKKEFNLSIDRAELISILKGR